MLIPIVKAVQYILIGCSFILCSGKGHLSFIVGRYVVMLLIACETVFRTGILAVLYMVATGWDTMKFNFSQR